jgi:uncharacterized RDD family membrane protein YckC
MARRSEPHALDPAIDGLSRTLATPEGLALRLTLASAGERATAFLIDVVIMLAILVAVSVTAVALLIGGRGGGRDLLATIWLLGAFVLRNGYFVLFELSGRAATPGKRAIGLRVIARDGGPLTAESILSRNALREIEVFLPVTLLGASAFAGDSIDGVVAALGLLWSLTFLMFPFFNRDRLRVGDLVAGTWVVRAPKVILLADLAAGEASHPFTFTAEQTGAYGVKELEILEAVLRRRDPSALSAVARRIRTRIGYPVAIGESELAFLAAFYAALRARLEQRLLFGHRRRDKYDAA